jgi:predicted RNA-binding protein with PUA domain
MWNIKTKYTFLVFVFFTVNNVNSQEHINFFYAKSEVSIERNGVKEDFIAHIRYNLKDTLWVSFNGTFGIEGARMLVTKDSTFIINKLDKSGTVFTNEEENDIIPYAFSLEDWKVLLLNIPLQKDSSTEIVMENDILLTTNYSIDKIQKTFQKNNRILKCQFKNTRRGMLCEVVYNQYDNSTKTWNLARERHIQISQSSAEPIKIAIKYLDFTFNEPKPFHFNFSKYKNETAP